MLHRRDSLALTTRAIVQALMNINITIEAKMLIALWTGHTETGLNPYRKNDIFVFFTLKNLYKSNSYDLSVMDSIGY